MSIEKKNINVLVTGAGGDVAQGVLKSLLDSDISVKLYTTCISQYSAWLYHKDVVGIIAPPSSSKMYIDFLISTINHYKIDALFPTIDSEICSVTENTSIIESKTGAKVFTSNLESTLICDDKYKTYKHLQKHSFHAPKTIEMHHDLDAEYIKDSIGLPLIIKKKSGNGSKGIYICHAKSEIEAIDLNDSLVAQELLDLEAPEITAGVYIGDDGRIKGTCIFERHLRNGSTCMAKRIIDSDLEFQVEQIANSLNMKYINIQGKLIGGKIIPFELNGRLSGTTSMVRHVFNAPELFIRERILDQKIEIVSNSTAFIALRCTEEVYVNQSQVDAVVRRSIFMNTDQI